MRRIFFALEEGLEEALEAGGDERARGELRGGGPTRHRNALARIVKTPKAHRSAPPISSIRWRWRRAAFAIGALSIVCAAMGGCRAELGECDEREASKIVFIATDSPADPRRGVPMFAGQALMVTSCGGDRFCHSSADIAPDLRYGVPDGLSLDPSLACYDANGCTEEERARLAAEQARIFEMSREILRSVRRGSMPPKGTPVLEERTERIVDIGTSMQLEGAEEVPPIGTREGDEILRNWLACGAPVVEFAALPAGGRPGDPCEQEEGSVGECRRRVYEPVAPDPTWSSIYEDVIRPLCGISCHGPTPPNFIQESGLDLSEKDRAYEALIDEVAKGRDCTGMGTLIIPGNSNDSLFMDKLEPTPLCGDPMPSLGLTLDPAILDVLAEWIDRGAPDD